jgi:HD-GYP domain-containing protein (c-di-GMP phosphodiesterase class II)
MYDDYYIDIAKKILFDSFRNEKFGEVGEKTIAHCERTANYSKIFVEKCRNINKELVNSITAEDAYLVGIIHDIGKSLLSPELLREKSELTEEQKTELKKHPGIGYHLIKAYEKKYEIIFGDLAYEGILYHHRKYNGKGYPKTDEEIEKKDVVMKGERIPLISRIIGFFDCYDSAGTRPGTNNGVESNKCYSNKGEFIAHLKEERGEQFDPNIVDAVLEIMRKPIDTINEKTQTNISYRTKYSSA